MKWIFTGISGSGRKELLEDLKNQGLKNGKKIIIHDIGDIMFEECKRLRISFDDQRILDVDSTQLRLVRALAIKQVKISIQESEKNDLDMHCIGIHAAFRWKHRLISGISYSDILTLKPDGFINVVDDVKRIYQINKKNPKWKSDPVPDISETQEWLIEEEFLTEILAEVASKPMYLIARQQNIANLMDLFFTNKKKIYLSYPITAIKDEKPNLLRKIQGPLIKRLEEYFVVFNPLDIKDMSLTYKSVKETELPELIEQLTSRAIDKIKTRTIARDYQFIDQSDLIIVFYLTDKVSPGVLSEILYAYRNQKPVYMVYQFKLSPFLEEVISKIYPDIESLMRKLKIISK